MAGLYTYSKANKRRISLIYVESLPNRSLRIGKVQISAQNAALRKSLSGFRNKSDFFVRS